MLDPQGTTMHQFRKTERYDFDNYLQAKAALLLVWKPLGDRLPLCAICGTPAVAPEAHHVFVSRRYVLTDIRNMIPVCHQAIGTCHAKAHAGETALAIQRLYYVLGRGDRHDGRAIVAARIWSWPIKSIPDVTEEELWNEK